MINPNPNPNSIQTQPGADSLSRELRLRRATSGRSF
jgi:hypothetical protein